MKAPSVTLIKQRQKLSGGRVVYYWRLRWPGKDGRPRTESIGRVDEMTEAEAGEIRRRKIQDLGTGHALRDRPGMTIGQYLDLDREALLSVVQPGTIKTHDNAKQRLIGAIGDDVKLDKIEWHHVDRLINWLSTEHRINGKTRPGCSRATVSSAKTATQTRLISATTIARSPVAATESFRTPMGTGKASSVTTGIPQTATVAMPIARSSCAATT